MANPYRPYGADSSTTMTPQEMKASKEAAESSIWDNTIQDFGAEVIGALTGYTPEELQMMGSGEITVNELNEPVYAKTGEAADPSGKANPMSIGEFGVGTLIPAKGVPKLGDFSDIFMQKAMRWLPDNKVTLRTHNEIAKIRRDKMLGHLDNFKGEDYSKAKVKELKASRARLSEINAMDLDDPYASPDFAAKRQLLRKERSDLNEKLGWLEDEGWEAGWVKQGLSGYSESDAIRLDELMVHDELFKAMPELGKMKVVFDDALGLNGSYNPWTDVMTLGSKNKLGAHVVEGISFDTLGHEIQHGIQARSGWSKGTNAKSKQVLDQVAKNKKAAADLEVIVDKEYEDLVTRNRTGNEMPGKTQSEWDAREAYREETRIREKVMRNKEQDLIYLQDNSDAYTVYLNNSGEQQARATGSTFGHRGRKVNDPYAKMTKSEAKNFLNMDVDNQILPKPNFVDGFIPGGN